MRFWALVAAVVLGLMVGLLSVTTASAASINVAPTNVPVGGTVTVSGDVLGPDGKPACVVPGQGRATSPPSPVTLISGAFAGQGSFQNQDVETTANADGGSAQRQRSYRGCGPARIRLQAAAAAATSVSRPLLS
jgi:hypothetical protein